MMKQINFIPISQAAETVPPPVPASNNLPHWYKNIPAFSGGKKPTFKDKGDVDTTLKMCVPFADSLRLGYVQQTWTEINFSLDEQGIMKYSFPMQPDILTHRDTTHLSSDFFKGHYPIELTWQMQYLPKLPKGYSILITHPLNRQDLPFTTLTGVIDADDYFHYKDANVPFMLKENFAGIIPLGTPMLQMIPFKRDDWTGNVEIFDASKQQNGRNIHRYFWQGYKKLVWKKKTFK